MITILKDEEFRTAILSAIREATREILITTYKMDYRESPKIRHLNAIVEALGRARMRGVNIYVLLNGDSRKSKIGRINREARETLYHKRIVARLSPRGRTSHAKLIIIDKCLAFVGSHNLSESSLCRNFEVSLMINPNAREGFRFGEEKKTIQDLRQIYLKEWEKGR